MNYVDIILIVVLLFAIVKGYLRGFVVEIFSLLGLFLGIYLAVKTSPSIVASFFPDSQYAMAISAAVFIGVFVLIMIITGLSAKILKKAIDLTMLGFFDNALGSLFGLIKWGLYLSIFIWLFGSIDVRMPEKIVDESLLYPYIEMIGPYLFDILGSIMPFLRDIFDFMDELPGAEKLVNYSDVQ